MRADGRNDSFSSHESEGGSVAFISRASESKRQLVLPSNLTHSLSKSVELVPEESRSFAEPLEARLDERVVEPDRLGFGLGGVSDFFPLGPSEAGPDRERPRFRPGGDFVSRDFVPAFVPFDMCVALVPANSRFRTQERRVHVRPGVLQLLSQFLVPLLARAEPALDDLHRLLPRPSPAVVETTGQLASAASDTHRVDEFFPVRPLPRALERGEVIFDDLRGDEGAFRDDERGLAGSSVTGRDNTGCLHDPLCESHSRITAENAEPSGRRSKVTRIQVTGPLFHGRPVERSRAAFSKSEI